MFKKGQQQKHFKSIWDAMVFHLITFFDTQKPESLHQFRLQIKKMKSLLFFIPNNAQTPKRSHYFKSVQLIYQHAGRIRSAHLHLLAFRQSASKNPEQQQKQEQIYQNETALFCAKRRAYLKVLYRINQVFSGNFEDIAQKTILKRYKKQFKKLIRQFEKQPVHMKTFHNCRKKIKNMLYFYNTLPKKIARKLHLNTRYLDQLQDAIGQYHDADLFQALTTAPKRQIVQSNRKYDKMCALIQQFREENAIY